MGFPGLFLLLCVLGFIVTVEAQETLPAQLSDRFGCVPPHHKYPFCDQSMPVHDRVLDLVKRINDTDKANLLTARGRGGNGQHLQDIPALGVPGYYWGTNCLHSLNGGHCIKDSKNRTVCPSNFPSGPSFGAMFDRDLIARMATVIGVELRAMFLLDNQSHPSLDCWGPVINLNRDPRWGRNGEGGLEDAYAMGELATAWTQGFQSPRPSSTGASRQLLQGVITLKHMAANSLDNTAPYNRHTFNANVDNFVLADYYFRPFKSAIRDGDARGVMCSYNAVQGVPTCLSKLIHQARIDWGFNGYVTSDSDSIADAWASHRYCKYPMEATALGLHQGGCDIDSGDSYIQHLQEALDNRSHSISMDDVDHALYNTFKQRFDLGLFDPPDSYDWPTRDDVGTSESWDLTLQASQEALVLLRNDNGLLPLRPGSASVAVIGPHAMAKAVLMEPYPFKPYCPDNTLDCIMDPFSAIAGLNRGAHTFTPNSTFDLFNATQSAFNAAVEAATAADVVVMALGIETCGLTPEHNRNPKAPGPGRCIQEQLTTVYQYPDQYLELEAHDRTTIALPPGQKDLAKAVLALGKPTVVVLFNAGMVAIDFLTDISSNNLAIIEAFYPGPRGGEALAQGIFGEMNRWGRLPYTIYPEIWEKEADMTEHDLRVPPGRTYRYYREPTYAFGEGLSLTSFELQVVEAQRSETVGCLVQLTTSGGVACPVQVSVRNTGPAMGDVVVMLYSVTANADDDHTSTRIAGSPHLLSPLRQLVGFERARDVAAGASTTVTFNITSETVATYDEDSGDLVSKAGRSSLRVDDGSGRQGGSLELPVVVTGSPVVVDPFPIPS